MIISKLPTQSSIMTVISKAVVRASKGLLRDFSELENLQVSIKPNNSVVTNADIRANSVLKEALLQARPSYSLISEESEETEGSDPSHKWIIDPLDGTMNYMHGMPHWAISVALEKNGEIIAALTFDPLRDEMFWAEKGCGAYMNDRKLRVSGRRFASDALLAVESVEKIPQKVLQAVSGVRKTGCVTLDMAYLAAGRCDMLILDGRPNRWDVSAGMLLIKEAGGVVTSKLGESTTKYNEAAIMCNVDLIQGARKVYDLMHE